MSRICDARYDKFIQNDKNEKELRFVQFYLCFMLAKVDEILTKASVSFDRWDDDDVSV